VLNSRKIDDLRPDVAANCRKFIAKMAERGYPKVGVMTVRDDEYQADCYKRGTGGEPPATFHAIHAGLAFDVFKNVKGHAYDDPEFFRVAGEVGKEIGFTWGGDWKKPDRPHFQWDDNGKYSGRDIIKRRYPPQMPLYGEGEKMDAKKVKEIVVQEFSERDAVIAEANKNVALWAQIPWEKAVAAGVFDGSRPGAPLTRQELAIILARLGLV
jgi:hypothetical protein